MSFKLNPFTSQWDEVGTTGGGGGGVTSFNGRTGIVTSQAGDYSADQISYDNTTSGLSATDVQAAIDELAAETNNGNPNTIAFYNATGDLDSNLNAKYNQSTGSLAIGYTTAGGTFTSTGNGSAILGWADSTGTLSSLSGGSLAVGFVSGASSVIQATSGGSLALGFVGGGGRVESNGPGSMSFGNASGTSSQIYSTNEGSLAHGLSDTGGDIEASGPGSLSQGNASGAGSSIIAGGTGSIATGRTDAGFSIEASGEGSISSGWAIAGNIQANHGSFALGYAETNDVATNGVGSISIGDDIVSTADFAQAFGKGHGQFSYLSMVTGRYSKIPPNSPSTWVSTDPLFVVGNGANAGSRSNAFQVDKDGSLYINDPSLSGASVGYVWKVQNVTTGLGAWAPDSSGSTSTTATLIANTVSNTEAVNFTVPLNVSLAYGATIEYSMLSDNGDVRKGLLEIAYNVANTIAVRNDTYLETAPLSVTLDVDISGGNLRLLYTNTDLTNNVTLTGFVVLIN